MNSPIESSTASRKKEIVELFPFARMFPKAWTIASKFHAVIEIDVQIFLTKSSVVLA